jgi:2-dehydro-3-deoxyphosphogluconate aldolase/(4S)-4-hydroxy-2-oxoglutarate aldolase
MPPVDRLTVLRTILEDGAVPTYAADDPESAWAVVAACRDAGSRAVEFTNRGDFAYATFATLARRAADEAPGVILGAGTIVDAPTAALFIAAGARFIVGQSFAEDVARLCNRHRVAYIPGCGTATEIGAAEELGCEIVKLFPAAALDGAAFIRGMHGPQPASRIMPTNVEATEEATRRWFAAGAAAVGVGPHLLPPALIASRDVPAMTEKVRMFLGWVEDAREAAATR